MRFPIAQINIIVHCIVYTIGKKKRSTEIDLNNGPIKEEILAHKRTKGSNESILNDLSFRPNKLTSFPLICPSISRYV